VLVKISVSRYYFVQKEKFNKHFTIVNDANCDQITSCIVCKLCRLTLNDLFRELNVPLSYTLTPSVNNYRSSILSSYVMKFSWLSKLVSHKLCGWFVFIRLKSIMATTGITTGVKPGCYGNLLVELYHCATILSRWRELGVQMTAGFIALSTIISCHIPLDKAVRSI